jgi:hypothetical protein
LLKDLNAISTTTMEEFDYDRYLQAYERMDASIFAQFNRSTGLLVLSQAVFDMGSEDMFSVLRAVCSHLLSLRPLYQGKNLLMIRKVKRQMKCMRMWNWL